MVDGRRRAVACASLGRRVPTPGRHREYGGEQCSKQGPSIDRGNHYHAVLILAAPHKFEHEVVSCRQRAASSGDIAVSGGTWILGR